MYFLLNLKRKRRDSEMERIGKKNQIDMLNGPLLSKILIFALPLAASSILQQLFNAADVAVVGKFVGSEALAAVGGNAPVISLLINLFVGLSIGSNVVIAGNIGRQNYKKVKEAVQTTISVALLSGFGLMIVGFFAAKPILILIDTPDETIELAVLYLKIYFAGMPFLMIYNFGSAILRSIGDTKRPLYCLILAGIINVALNLFFVIVCKMSVAGVGLATVISNGISSAIIIYLLMREDEIIRLDLKKLFIKKDSLINITKIGAPAGIQGVVFSISNVCIQFAINGFGTHAIAGSSAALNFECFIFFMVSAFGQAAVTFTSQNFGAANYDRCKRVLRICMIWGLIISGLMCVICLFGKELFLSVFTSKPEDIEYGVIRVLHVGVLECLTCFYEITGGALRGMGHSMIPAVMTIFGTCVLRIIWVYTIFQKIPTFEMLLNVYPVTWIVTGIFIIVAYYIISKKAFRKNLQANTL